ncbi:MAG: ABC transporter ATP-binding protein [Candidatus Marinimicrobia bacterium]|nr:ABC transporter ATP-binding protein [Candidatus Neomarinimicrobiota bacterium]
MDHRETDYTQKFQFSTWRKVLPFARPYRTTMILLAVFMIAVAGVDIVMPLMTRYAVDTFIVPKNADGLGLFAIIYLSITLFQAVNVAIFILFAGKVETGVSYGIRKAGFSKLQELSFSYYDHASVGWLMTRITSDTTKLSEIIAWGLVDLVWGGSLMIGIATVMFIMHWKLTLLVLSVVPLLFWVSKKFQVLILSSYREVRKTNSKITASFNEGIMGAVTTKTLVRETDYLREFTHLTDKMYSSSFRAAVQSALYMPLVQIASVMGAGLAIWFGGSGVIAGDISYGMLVMFLSYATFFFQPVQEMARVFAELQNAQAAAERITSLIETDPEIRDHENTIQLIPSSLRGDIRFDNVGFEYKQGQKILNNFNLDVEAGSSIALVGETGGGKTSIISLVCRFYEPTSGKISIDGQDYTLYPLQWLQSHLGVVLQTPHLFSGTIMENIRYGKLTATDEEVIRAATQVQADAFISQLADGYSTIVTEGGTNLSTGQKQLISLARAIIADPAILIMDEATSSVDTETERLIQHAIDKLVKGRTSFIIAHRLSTIRNANRILVIEKGNITEDGNHDELITLKGRYFQLYTNQFQEEKTKEILK